MRIDYLACTDDSASQCLMCEMSFLSSRAGSMLWISRPTSPLTRSGTLVFGAGVGSATGDTSLKAPGPRSGLSVVVVCDVKTLRVQQCQCLGCLVQVRLKRSLSACRSLWTTPGRPLYRSVTSAVGGGRWATSLEGIRTCGECPSKDRWVCCF